MSAYVLDASVIAALYVDEPLSEVAERALAAIEAERAETHAPELLLYEVASALWKRTRRGELSTELALERLQDLAAVEIELHPAYELAPQALSLALAHDVTVYDAAYLALAVRLGATVVTADTRLRERAAAATLPTTAPETLASRSETHIREDEERC